MKITLRLLGGILVFIFLLLAVSALSNTGLPGESPDAEHLSEAVKARVAEMYHLRVELGDMGGFESGEVYGCSGRKIRSSPNSFSTGATSIRKG